MIESFADKLYRELCAVDEELAEGIFEKANFSVDGSVLFTSLSPAEARAVTAAQRAIAQEE